MNPDEFDPEAYDSAARGAESGMREAIAVITAYAHGDFDLQMEARRNIESWLTAGEDGKPNDLLDIFEWLARLGGGLARDLAKAKGQNVSEALEDFGFGSA